MPMSVSSVIFCGLCVPLVLSPFFLGGEDATGLFLWETWVIGLGCLWACTQWGRGSSRVRPLGWDLLLALLVIWCILSYAVSDYRFSSQIELVKLGAYLLFAYMILALLDPGRVKILVGSILLASVIQGIFIFVQFSAGGVARPPGSFLDPNFAGLSLFFGIVICASWCLLPGTIGPRGRLGFGLLGLGLLGAAVINGSRSVGALVILLLAALIVATRRARWVLLACLLGLLLLPSLTRMRLLEFGETDVYAWQRLNIWKGVLRVIGDHPWMGVGLGNLPDHTYPYNFPVESHPARYAKRFTSAHNNLLQAAAELGIPGALLATLWLCRLGWSWRRGLLHVEARGLKVYLWMAAGVVGGFLLQGMVMDNLRSPSLVLSVLSMLAVVRHVELESMETPRPTRWGGWWQGRAGTSLGVMLSVPVVTIVWPLLVLSPYLSWRGFLQADALAREGRLAEAEKRLSQAIRLNSGQPYYWQLLAELRVAAARQEGKPGDLADAFRYLYQAVSLNPSKPDLYAQLASLCKLAAEVGPKKASWLQQAERHMAEAIVRNPLNVFYRYERASILLELRDVEGARLELEKALSLEPNFTRGHEALASVYEMLGRGEDADRHRRTAKYLAERFKGWKSKGPYERLLFETSEATARSG